MSGSNCGFLCNSRRFKTGIPNSVTSGSSNPSIAHYSRLNVWRQFISLAASAVSSLNVTPSLRERSSSHKVDCNYLASDMTSCSSNSQLTRIRVSRLDVVPSKICLKLVKLLWLILRLLSFKSFALSLAYLNASFVFRLLMLISQL